MNKTGGRATYKGINAQSWAALSLFLQHVRGAGLDYIAFEQEKLKDFDLVFSSGKKIICESKTEKITHGVLKEILDKLVDNKKVGQDDQILIICQAVSPRVESDVENLKYFEELREKLKNKGFTDQQLDLFPRIKIWKVDRDTNELIVTSILSEILVAWFPDSVFNEIVSNILIDKIYKGSEFGGIFTRKEFYQMVDERKKQVQEDAGYRNEHKEKLERIDKILLAIDKPTSRDWCNNEISLLTTTPDLYYLTIIKLGKLPDLKLYQWDNLWQAAAKGTFSLNVFDILKKNVSDPENQKYLVDFLPTVIEKLLSFYRQEFIVVDIVKICSAIQDVTRSYDEQIFGILKNLIEINTKEIFFVKKGRDNEWEQEQTTEALKVLYEKTNDNVKQEIISFIFEFFDLVSDDGQYWHSTPNSIFEILKLYVEGDVEARILSLSEALSKQYEKFYMRFSGKSSYKGWEYIGFTDTDRHFLTYILQPVLIQYFSKNPDAAWAFITKKLVTPDEKLVSLEKPDYLNRAVIPVVMSAYLNPKYKNEALAIIKNFVEMKKGIPHKTELIYKQIGDSFSDDQKLELVKLQLDYPPYKGLPVNGHVEKIVSDLAKKGHEDALDTLEGWAKNPEYNKYKGVLEGNITSTVPGLLANPTTKERGVAILKQFLDSDFFINKQGLWDVWETAKVLTQVLTEEFDEGKLLLEEIWSNDSLSRNQQVVITNGINGIDKNEELIVKAYDQIISVWLTDCKDDIAILIKRIPDIQSRNSLVQFGEKLAKAGKYDAAIRIAKIFINDPNPTLENDPDDPEGKHNYHQRVKKGEEVNNISTVRGWVAWLLQNVATLRGRDYIPEIIPLVEKLTLDPNYYVRAYSCIPLEFLAHNRHTVLPSDANTRFLDHKTAEEIERIAYTMLRNKENWEIEQIMMGILRVFSNFRSVTTEEAKEILNTFLGTKSNKIIEEARGLFIFFAEFRANSINEKNLIHVFSKERIEELKTFDDKYFKELLVKILEESSSVVRAGFAWAFWHLPKEQGADFNKFFNIAYKYLSIIVDRYDHEVMTNIYYFIEEFSGQKFEECFELWKKCLIMESAYLQEKITKENLYEMHWWPYHYNGKILIKVADSKGETEFLKWVDYLADYPENVIIANDLNLVIERLVQLPVTDQSKLVFEKLAARSPEYFEEMKRWLENV